MTVTAEKHRHNKPGWINLIVIGQLRGSQTHRSFQHGFLLSPSPSTSVPSVVWSLPWRSLTSGVMGGWCNILPSVGVVCWCDSGVIY